jgi:molybdopterin-binding protein
MAKGEGHAERQGRHQDVGRIEGHDDHAQRSLPIGQAAELIGVSVETLRRWEEQGRLRAVRTAGGQRRIPVVEVTRLLAERRPATPQRPIVAQSARNRFPGVVTRIEKDRVAAVVEVLAGPHRIVSLLTAEAVDDLRLRVGDEAVAVVKATNVIIEIPSPREVPRDTRAHS